MARVKSSGRHNLVKIAENAGQPDESKRSYIDGELIIKDVSQEALDAAVTSYNSMQSLKDNRKWEIAKAMDSQIRDEIPTFTFMRLLMKRMDRGAMTPNENSVIQKVLDANNRLAQLESQIDNAKTEEEILAIRW